MRRETRIRNILRESSEVKFSPVILGELFSGFISGSGEKANRSILSDILDDPRFEIVPMIEETAERYSYILSFLRSAGKKVPTNDVWIAATAMEHGLELVTCDRHFTEIPQVRTTLIQ